ncbi:MAG: tetratricopeptide repeat protein [Spirochaetaceae bacterium]|jgi:tetratricopeptide (TPR) repeat protein|nr:tetratricopeptide repeat protein [Spirochaetaceae bacterium]
MTKENYCRRGAEHYQSGEVDLAIADFSEAICLDPNDAGVYYMRGNMYFLNKNDHDKAIADFDRAIKLDRNDAEAYYYRGLAYQMGRKDFAHAITDFTEALRLDPDNEKAHYHRGMAYYLLGDNNMANADFWKTMEMTHDPLQVEGFREKTAQFSPDLIAEFLRDTLTQIILQK